MKILYIVTAYPRNENDVITPWLVETISLLREQGEEITVFTSSYRGLGNQIIAGTPVIRFRYFPRRWEDLTHDETAVDRVKKGLLNKLKAVCYLLCGSFAVWRHCRTQHYDIIHVHWPLPHYLFGWFAARACRAPVVISFHGAEVMVVRHGLKFLRPFLRWAIRSAAAITANSSHTVKAIQEICNRPVNIVPYGTTVGESPGSSAGTEPAAETTRQTTAESEKKRPARLLFVGRLVERKGVPYLLEAVALLAQEMPVHLDIVGTGPAEPLLRRLAAERNLESLVCFRGFVSSAELTELYRHCDAFILPAIVDSKGDTEGLGVVIIDAMSHRRPVVASGLGGIVDLVIHEKTGLLVPPADAAALAQALRRILTDPELARRLGNAGYEHVRQHYSWPAIISRLREVYRKVAAAQ